MKKLLFVLTALLTIVSCSKNDELVEQPKHEKKGNTVSIIVDSPEGGTASRSGVLPGGSYSGDGTYEQDQDFTVAATADSKYHISYFYGGPLSNQSAFSLSCSSNPTSGSHKDTMGEEDHKYHVGFAKDSYSLTVSAGTGGNVSGGGDYEWGKTISISATPSSGYAFDSWVVSSGDATIANASSASTTATLNSTNSTIAAKFKQDNIVVIASFSQSQLAVGPVRDYRECLLSITSGHSASLTIYGEKILIEYDDDRDYYNRETENWSESFSSGNTKYITLSDRTEDNGTSGRYWDVDEKTFSLYIDGISICNNVSISQMGSISKKIGNITYKF